MEADERTDIWYLIGSLQIGGTNRTLVELCNNLDTDRYKVTLWTLLEPGELASDLESHVTLRSLDAAGKYDLRVPVRFIRAFRSGQPDILQSFLFFDNQLARLASPLSPSTTVITGVRAVPDDPSRHRALIDSLTMPLTNAVVSNSEDGATLAIERGADPKTVSVIHNGRDVETYRSHGDSSGLRRELDIPSSAPVVGTVGRLIHRKGHHDLLRAIEILATDHPEIHLLVIGDGPRREHLKDLANELGIRDLVTFAGARRDVPELLSVMDVFAFPSHFEGLPGALQEAMLAGLPLVTTPVDGNSELVTEGETGLFAPVKDPEGFAEALARLLQDKEFAQEMGDEAATDAADRFATERMIDEFDDLYRSLLD